MLEYAFTVVESCCRTIQTAVGVFGGEEYTDEIDALPLMVENAGDSDHSSISSLNCPPFISVEKCREHLVSILHQGLCFFISFAVYT